jgi:MFS transporter, MHS family, shikimate and dehydroshikimate transport protein
VTIARRIIVYLMPGAASMFPSNLRYSGASLGYQLAAPVGGGLVPLAATAIVDLTEGATWPVWLLKVVIASMTMLAVLAARETAPKVATMQPTFA